MARLPRFQYEGAVYHVNIGGVEGVRVFEDDTDVEAFRWTLGTTVDRHRLKLYMWCALTTHHHLLVETREANIAAAMCRLNGLYARSYNGRRRRKGHLFKQRYYAKVIQTEGQLLRTAAYVARNPEKAGLCTDPATWRWGSYGETLRESRPWPANAGHELLARLNRDPAIARQLLRALVDSKEALELP